MSTAQEARPPFDAPWLARYAPWTPPSLDYPEHPAWGYLVQAALRAPDRPACVYYDQTINYAQLHELARSVAVWLRSVGVKPGDRVGLLMPNMPEFPAAAYGVWMAGGVVTSLSPLSVPEEISALIESTECRVVVSLDLLAPLVFQAEHRPERLLVVTLRDRLPFWEGLGYGVARFLRVDCRSKPDDVQIERFAELPPAPADFTPHPAAPHDPAFIIPTGGTTGAPKAVVVSHRNLVANAEQIMHWAGKRFAKETFLAVLPFFHSYGLSTCVTAGVGLAATLILHHRFKPRATLRLAETHQPTFFLAVPAMLAALNKELLERRYNLRSLRYCISGGAPLDPAVAAVFAEHTGATVVEGYGLSEASPVTHVGPLDGNAQPACIGLPLPDVDARVVDPDQDPFDPAHYNPADGPKALDDGQVGELVLKGPQVMLGYWRQPEETARVLHDGWLSTGDLAVRDADGYFRVVDRKKDLIITSGFNVYPNEVEAVLRRFPGVRDAAVVGEDDPDRGQVVKAFVALHKGVKFHRWAFDHFAQEHLGKHKRPRLVEVVDGDLPRNFLGKVQRRKLRGLMTVEQREAAVLAEADRLEAEAGRLPPPTVLPPGEWGVTHVTPEPTPGDRP